MGVKSSRIFFESDEYLFLTQKCSYVTHEFYKFLRREWAKFSSAK